MNATNEQSIELHNNHNVYILGAGFSAFRGLPLIGNFMHRMRDAYDFMVSKRRIDESRAIARVLQFRRDSAAAAYLIRLDLENIEELFSLASVLGDEYSEALRLAIAATISFSQEVSPETQFSVRRDLKRQFALPSHWKLSSNVRDLDNNYATFVAPAYEVLVQGLLGKMGEPNSSVRNTFVTFNYDLLVESALSKLGHDFSYGFSSMQSVHEDKLGTLRHLPSANLKLLKLHGSMNWATNPTTLAMELYESYEWLRESDRIPELMPPTWRKSFTAATQAVWKAAIAEIRGATRLVVVGFSIPPTDLHFKYLIAAGLRDNLSLREIVFYDPALDLLHPRVESLFSDVERLPRVQLFDRRAETLVSPGTGPGTLAEYGRPVSRAIANVERVLGP